MKFYKILSIGALLLPLSVMGAPAFAATTHNLQTGADTSNANDPGMGMKKMHMKKMHMKKHKAM